MYIVDIMKRDDWLGGFEFMVLAALLRLEEQAYGVTIRQELELRTGRDISIGAVYSTLNRLETKGYVRSRFGEPTPERGGRSKRFFIATAAGVAAVQRSYRATRSLIAGLDLSRSQP
jgi:PadR family transcriptional regulator PadR